MRTSASPTPTGTAPNRSFTALLPRPAPESRTRGPSGQSSASDGVPLHAARVRRCLQGGVGLPPCRADAAEGPVARHLDVVFAGSQPLDRVRARTLLDGDMALQR